MNQADIPDRKRIVFIVNPASGVGRQKGIEFLIDRYLDTSKFSFSVWYTEKAGHATELSREAVSQGLDAVIAVGGDGTINEIAQGLVGTDVALGIVPAGSGNGLSRHLMIPMNPGKALRVLNSYKTARIDTATLNGGLFVSVAGVGFDASVAKKFSRAGKRGFRTYFTIVALSYPMYRPKKYKMVIDGKEITRRALLVSFANSSQFGNNASIDVHSTSFIHEEVRPHPLYRDHQGKRGRAC
jgi:diacylglycerol kinase family enzyme